jgi:hypothetical protein
MGRHGRQRDLALAQLVEPATMAVALQQSIDLTAIGRRRGEALVETPRQPIAGTAESARDGSKVHGSGHDARFDPPLW